MEFLLLAVVLFAIAASADGVNWSGLLPVLFVILALRVLRRRSVRAFLRRVMHRG